MHILMIFNGYDIPLRPCESHEYKKRNRLIAAIKNRWYRLFNK